MLIEKASCNEMSINIPNKNWPFNDTLKVPIKPNIFKNHVVNPIYFRTMQYNFLAYFSCITWFHDKIVFYSYSTAGKHRSASEGHQRAEHDLVIQYIYIYILEIQIAPHPPF